MFRFLSALVCVFCVMSSVTAQPFLEKKDYKVFFSENPIFIDPPLIEVEGKLFAPIRFLSESFQYTISYRRKTDEYVLTKDKNQIQILNNSRAYFVNGNKHLLPHQTVMNRSRTYIPLKAFLEIAGYEYEKKKSNIYIFEKELAQPTLSPAPEPAAPPKSTVLFSIKKNKSRLPTHTQKNKTFVSEITLIKNDKGNYQLIIEGDKAIKMSLTTRLNGGKRVYWDIRGATALFNNESLKIKDSLVNRVDIFQHPDFLRVALGMNEAILANKTQTENQGLVTFQRKNTTLTPNPDQMTKIAKPPVIKTSPVILPKGGLPLKGKIVAIDPGHGGGDPGAVVQKHIYEKKYTLDISKRLQKRLEAAGAKVVMARTADSNPSLYWRSNQANTNKADIVLSVHINSFFKPFARGTETYYYKAKDKPLAAAIHTEMVRTLKLRDNGLKRSKMYILNHTSMPGALIEPLFMTNQREFDLLQDPQFRQKIADATYTGVVKYFKSRS